MSVKTIDCLKKLGFHEVPVGVEYDNGKFSCSVTETGMPMLYMTWQANERRFGESNVWMLPIETRIWPEFLNWNQFLAGFSFILTQARFQDLCDIFKLVGTDIKFALLEGGKHFKEFEPIKKFIAQRDVTDADFVRIEEYVNREDSTFTGYNELIHEIQHETRWSKGGFKYGRE